MCLFASTYTVSDFQFIREEIAKKSMALALLWEEYCQRVLAAGRASYLYTQFCETYYRLKCATNASETYSVCAATHTIGTARRYATP